MAVSILFALFILQVVGAQNTSISLLERAPCTTWFPLGDQSQRLATLPYTAICIPSDDGTQLIMQVVASRQDTPFTGLVATAIRRNYTAWTDVGSFDLIPFGFTLLECPDGSQSVVKSDFSEEFVFSQAWNMPEGVGFEEVGCRFLIAQTEDIYWNDVIAFAVNSVDSNLVVSGGSDTQNSMTALPADPTADPFGNNLVIGGQATPTTDMPNVADNVTSPSSENLTMFEEPANLTLTDILHGSNGNASTLMANTTEAPVETTTGILVDGTTSSSKTFKNPTTKGKAIEAAGSVSAGFANSSVNVNATDMGGLIDEVDSPNNHSVNQSHAAIPAQGRVNATDVDGGDNVITTTGSIMDATTWEIISSDPADNNPNMTSFAENHQNVTGISSNVTSNVTNLANNSWNVTDTPIITTTATLDMSNATSVTADTSNTTSVTADTSNTTSVTADTSNTPSATADTSNATSVTADTSNTTSVTADTSNTTSVTADTSNTPSATADTSNSTANTFNASNAANFSADTSFGSNRAVNDSTTGVFADAAENANGTNTPSLSDADNVSSTEAFTTSTATLPAASKASINFAFNAQNFNASSASNAPNATDLSTNQTTSRKQEIEVTTQTFELTTKVELTTRRTPARVQDGTNTVRSFSRRRTTTARAPPPLVPRSVTKTVRGQSTSFWCESRGTLYVLMPGSRCKTYYVGNYQQSMTEVSPMARLDCGPGTAFDTNICGCAWLNSFTCP